MTIKEKTAKGSWPLVIRSVPDETGEGAYIEVVLSLKARQNIRKIIREELESFFKEYDFGR